MPPRSNARVILVPFHQHRSIQWFSLSLPAETRIIYSWLGLVAQLRDTQPPVHCICYENLAYSLVWIFLIHVSFSTNMDHRKWCAIKSRVASVHIRRSPPTLTIFVLVEIKPWEQGGWVQSRYHWNMDWLSRELAMARDWGQGCACACVYFRTLRNSNWNVSEFRGQAFGTHVRQQADKFSSSDLVSQTFLYLITQLLRNLVKTFLQHMATNEIRKALECSLWRNWPTKAKSPNTQSWRQCGKQFLSLSVARSEIQASPVPSFSLHSNLPICVVLV